MAAAEAVFEESLFQALKCYQFGECFRPKELIRSTVVLKREANFFTRIGKSLIFQLLPFVFDSRHGSTDSFILVVSPLKMRDQINNLWPPGSNCWKIKEVIIL